MSKETKPYVLCLGEMLIDFTSASVSASGSRLFEQNAGGAPANVACALSRLGSTAFFCGKVGKDMFGDYLKVILQSEGVDPGFLVQDDEAPTTLAFVSLQDNGEREFSFVRNPGADTRLEYRDVPLEVLRNASVLHFGTLSLTHEPSAGTLIKAIDVARENGVLTSIDINLRPDLWSDLDQAYASIHGILPKCDLVKMSYEELLFTVEGTNGSTSGDVRTRAEAVLKRYPGVLLLAVTMGGEGSQVFYRSEAGSQASSICVPAHRVTVVDSTGAGDSYVAGLLHSILNHSSFPAFLSSSTAVQDAVEFASAAAALSVTKRGAIAAMPYAEEVQEQIKRSSG